jgi:hypothetical protein
MTGKGTCSIKGCHRPVRAAGRCGTHYERRRKGEHALLPIRSYNLGKKCFVEGCDKPAISLGFCRAHYQRNRRARVRRGVPTRD